MNLKFSINKVRNGKAPRPTNIKAIQLKNLAVIQHDTDRHK